MNLLAIALVISVASSGLLLSAPPADARGFCSSTVDSWCPGNACINENGSWFCEDDIVVCIREPCP